MSYLKLIVLGSLITTSAFGNVSAYFNNNPKNSYTDPYRHISRQGDNLEEVILKEIKSAKISIYMAVQELRLPLISAALIERKKAGVDVRVVVENSYNSTVLLQQDPTEENEHEASRLTDLKAFVDVNRNGIFEMEELETRDAIYMLKKNKIPLMDDTFDSSLGSGLMHHKFMIVDGKSTIVSTANFTMSCVHGDVLTPESRGNANSMILVKSVNFAKIFNDEFAQLWGNGSLGSFGQSKTNRGVVSTTINGTKLTVQFSPTSQRHEWNESVNGLIDSYLSKATKSIKALLFVFSDQQLANTMEARHKAGTKIGVIIEPKFAFRDYSELLDMMGLGMLNVTCGYEPENNPWVYPAKEVGMSVLTKGDVLHHKFAVIDRSTVVVGSQNWSDSANFTNDETLVVIENARIADQFTQEYERVKMTAKLGGTLALKDKINKLEKDCADKGLNF